MRHIHCSCVRDEKEKSASRHVVSVSSILLQDGLEIQELPILVRLLDTGVVPLTNYTFTGEMVKPMTVEDENFQQMLQKCASVKEVFKLLEIPSELVTGYSASAALCRMCELQKMNTDWDNIHSFIRYAVLKELNDTVKRDVTLLTNETLFSLLSCYMNIIDNFGEGTMSFVCGEIEKRIVEERLTIKELCRANNILHSNPRGDKDLISSIWAHIANHYYEIKEVDMPLVLGSLPHSHKYLLKALGRQLHKYWWKMTALQVTTILTSLVKLNSLQVSIMTDVAHWYFLNIHQLKDDDLMPVVAAFIHFRFSNPKFTTALERFVVAREERLAPDLLGLIMEYCRSRRYFSPVILDAAGRHFVQFGQSYSALQMFTVLRPFGQLNYLPRDSHKLLVQTERMLEERFFDFHPSHLAELLCSFAFLEKVPLNFVKKVLTPSYLSKVKSMSDQLQAGVWLEMLQSAVKLDTRGVRIPFMYKLHTTSVWRDNRLWMIHQKLEETLAEILGSSVARMRMFAIGTIYPIDAEIHLDDDGKPVTVSYQSGQAPLAKTRLAVLIMTPDHYCVNSGHLLGEFSMRYRHLRKLGYTVIEVYSAEMHPMTQAERQSYVQEKLKKWLSA